MRQSDEVISELQGIADGLARGQNANANVADGCNRGRNHSSAVFHVADNAGVNPDDALYAVLLDAGAADCNESRASASSSASVSVLAAGLSGSSRTSSASSRAGFSGASS